jgi:serine/threonine-protein kinase
VIHRDIKPANIILGKHGETLVVDWGLAKAVGRADPSVGEQTIAPSSSGSSETMPGSALGTPAYMSPEQASGDLDRLGPRSDVYSLGATLYCLLTAKPPFAGDHIDEVLRKAQRCEFAPPRRIDTSIDKALEAVCLKAMAVKPEGRYDTPKALADDIERWMADEPVSAWCEPFSRRARRWARRNRTAVTAAGAAVLVALAGTAIVLAVQTRANRDLRDANAQTLRERDLARQNFDLARGAVDDYLTRVGQNPLLKEQGLHDLRRELLENALRYYRDFLGQRGEDLSLRVEAAVAYERAGAILFELGQFGDALAAFDQGLTLIEPSARDRVSDPGPELARVRLLAARARALRHLDSYSDAIATSEMAIQSGTALLAAGVGTRELPEILARIHLNAAIVARDVGGRAEAAVQSVLQAHELAEQAAADPGDLAATHTLLYVASIAAEMLRDAGRVEEACRLCEHGIAFGKSRLADHSRDIEIRMFLARLESEIGSLEKNRGHPREALKIIRGAADRLEGLARENHLMIDVRATWAMQLDLVGQLETDLGRYDQAERAARASIEVLEELVREVPSSPYFRYYAGRGYGTCGKALLKAGSHAEALALLRKSVAILETSNNLNDRYNLACTLALASTVADPAEGPTAAARQRRDADLAVDTLRQAIRRGWAYADVMRTDPDFQSISRRPDFQALLLDLALPANPFAR